MIRFAADENFNGKIIRGLQRRQPDIDIVRIQDTELYQKPDPHVLEWIAKERRILITHDERTIPKYAYARVDKGESMPGVFIVNDQLPVGLVIDELLLINGASDPAEWQNRVVHLPIFK